MSKEMTEQAKSILPADVNQALRELVRLSKKLVGFAEQETQALIKNDHLGFAYTQRDKEALSLTYAQASEEFRNRIEEFKGANKALIKQLGDLQNDLKNKTESNNVIIASIKKKAAANTQSTLFTVQQLGQRVTLADPIQERA